MSSLKPFDDGVRPVPLRKPSRIHFFPSKLQTRLLFWFVLAFIAEIALYSQLMQEHFTLTAWARFLLPHALVLPFGLRALRRLLLREVGRLEFTPHGVRFFIPNQGTSELAYEEISEYRIGVDASYWFRLFTFDGREFSVSRRSYVVTPEAETKIVRILGPRLPAMVAQTRPNPPTDPIERHAWDHFGDPPPIAMERGKRYRYISPTYLYSAKGDFSIFLVMLPTLVPGMFMLKRFPVGGFMIGIFFLYAVIAFLTFGSFWRAYILHRSGNDRFELTDEGIRVLRGERTWILRDPSPAAGIGGVYRFGRSLYRYGSGLKTYFFDPRFLEEDF